MKNVSIIIPTRNNLEYVKLAYASIRRYYPTTEIVILDDASTDGTTGWLTVLLAKDENLVAYYHRGRQIGHTVLYDKGVDLCKNDIFTIFHADMVCGPNYLENLTKHLKPQTVVSGTRIEPPLHPEGREKIVKDFGTYADDFKEKEFVSFCLEQQIENKDQTTKGIFAPWIMYKDDFVCIGGHDKYFAPFPYEDSDIFQRFILNGYDIIQSRDAFVWHFTCRGHRWTREVQKDDTFYKICCAKNATHFIRKWGSWIENDEFSFPIINPKYDIGFVIKNCNLQLLTMLEPWCSTLYSDTADTEKFIQSVQPSTPFNLSKRVKNMTDTKTNSVLVYFDGSKLTQDGFNFLTQLSKVILESGELGTMEHDIFRLEIESFETTTHKLIDNSHSTEDPLFINTDKEDPYNLNELFSVFERNKK